MVRTVNKDDAYAEFWAVKATSWFELPQFALALGEAAISEAAVERSFSYQGRVYTALRANMSQSHCEAQLWLAMNFVQVVHPKEADEKAKARALQREKMRAEQQRLIDGLVAKRQKR